MLASGWPGERSIVAALTEPVAAPEMTRFFEERATSSSGS
jgi:hypothetical protein